MKNKPAAQRFTHITDPVARKRLLTTFAPQDAKTLEPFKPTERGEIRFVSRQESVDEGYSHYTSERLCEFSKVYRCDDGRLVVLRRVATGNSFGADRAYNSTAVPA
ncbi:hypothetical protein [Stenotrophobium rhamnosiphilum]|uniref:Uncharacterized protein n=1 Tax=Stenotrophobium rhamnosiphilum TaxID=2029166 RepID=A0A2T5MEE8_9GAMM|nr:hypothetical protein [Stenotrophobium rhamnosiphilum]PTU30955.1 hypothetical protein CJD38_11655 [Stenotrophobium rhamnosiphilum]